MPWVRAECGKAFGSIGLSASASVAHPCMGRSGQPCDEDAPVVVNAALMPFGRILVEGIGERVELDASLGIAALINHQQPLTATGSMRIHSAEDFEVCAALLFRWSSRAAWL